MHEEKERNKDIWNKDQPPDPTRALTTCLMPGGPQQNSHLTHRQVEGTCLCTHCRHAQMESTCPEPSLRAGTDERPCAASPRVEDAACLAGCWTPHAPCVQHTHPAQHPAFCPGSCRTGPAAEGKHISAQEKCKRTNCNLVHMKRRKREAQRDGLQQKQWEFLGIGYLLRHTCADHVSPTAVG